MGHALAHRAGGEVVLAAHPPKEEGSRFYFISVCVIEWLVAGQAEESSEGRPGTGQSARPGGEVTRVMDWAHGSQ